MTEKLNYKVGDKVLVEVEIAQIDGVGFPYKLKAADTFLSWFSEDGLDKAIVNLPPKPKVTQAVMDWYENCEVTYTYIADYFDYAPTDVKRWLSEDVKNEHAFATLIAYGLEAVEVEKEKRYRVYLVGVKNQWNQRQCLTNNEDNYFFSGRCMVDTTYTKQELIDAGFEGVFDNLMFEVEEVE